MSEKLKPCAHCGGEAHTNIAGGGFYIFCNDCGVGVKKRIHPAVFINYEAQNRAEERLATEAWNRRHQDQSSSEYERLLSK